MSEASPGLPSPGNMSVPVNLLKPILNDLIANGRRTSRVQPYIGISADDSSDQIIVTRVSADGPASKAGIRQKDVIMTVNGSLVSKLRLFYEQVWASGEAGVTVRLGVSREGVLRSSASRQLIDWIIFQASNSINTYRSNLSTGIRCKLTIPSKKISVVAALWF